MRAGRRPLRAVWPSRSHAAAPDTTKPSQNMWTHARRNLDQFKPRTALLPLWRRMLIERDQHDHHIASTTRMNPARDRDHPGRGAGWRVQKAPSRGGLCLVSGSLTEACLQKITPEEYHSTDWYWHI